MPTQPYILKDGTRVPSVTTIIGRFKESGALIGWAMKRTRELDLASLQSIPENIFTLKNACLAITTAPTPRDQARGEAEAGTVAHAWFDNWARQEPLEEFEIPDDMRRLALNGLEAFKRWWDLHQFEVISSETPLVSEEYRFGGTRDMLVKDRNGEICTADWKCANAVYVDQYVPQLAAYDQLALECEGVEVSRNHLFRAGKQDASGHHHDWSGPTVKLGWELFLDYRSAYDRANKLKKF